jgi:ApaG protein
MKTALGSGIEIEVTNKYVRNAVVPGSSKFLFSYEVSIFNKNDFDIKLLRRYWRIVDLKTKVREIEGEGVIGETPIIESGGSYFYSSACDFETEMGKMSGYYLMENQANGSYFTVLIPDFTLSVPYRLN